MTRKNRFKCDFKKAIVGLFLLVMGAFTPIVSSTLVMQNAYADPIPEAQETENTETVETNEAEPDAANQETVEQKTSESAVQAGHGLFTNISNSVDCQASLGSIGWLVCPTTGKIAEAADWLFEKIEGFLVINPVSSSEDSPIYQIWKYCRDITNIVFIIFLLVVIYSQITGLGINNYGVKKALPKLIVAAIMVNLSFLICTLAVDLSNIIGSSLRGLFSSVAESAVIANSSQTEISREMRLLAEANSYGSWLEGAAIVIGAGFIAFESGAVWMLIPVVLGAFVAIASGLITIALRQAVVALLIMISPLAVIANILPNTEVWFKKWKDLLQRMLVFYPMFSLLFGASNLAGFAIIASAKDGFGILLGAAVQVFPLFFSWHLMKMSGTFLGTINAKLRSIADKPLAVNRGWADSHRQLTMRRMMASGRAYTPSARLMQFLANRKVAREAEISEKDEIIKNRGMAYHANSHYRRDGSISRKGENAYEGEARNMAYQRAVLRDRNNFERGLGEITGSYRNAAQRARLRALDKSNVDESDLLKAERARGALIEYENAKGFFDRVQKAQFAYDDQRAIDANNIRHQLHPGVLSDGSNIERFTRMRQILDGDANGVQEVLADAASSINAQAQIRRNKFQAAADLTPASQNIADHINDLIQSQNAINNIDAIVGGLRILNIRGDTDIVARQLSQGLVETLYDRMRHDNKLELGTYATQAIANYSMFDVKDRDPIIRRFGKYLNMQTAAIYNDGDPQERRNRKDVSWWEYINSQFVEVDDDGNPAHDENGNIIIKKTKGMRELMAGTSYKGVEKTAFKSQIAAIRDTAYDLDENGEISHNFSLDRFINNESALWNTIMANLIGDHLSYLSGSEQVMTLRKSLLFVDPKTNKFDWEGAFGKEIADNLSIEDKTRYIKSLKERVKSFYGGQVPVQIARSKSDMLSGVKNLYALLSYIEDENGEIDPERLGYLEENTFGDGADNGLGNYKEFESQQTSGIKKRFVDSLDPKALEGFVKMYRKGYQGEAKKALLELIGAEILNGDTPVNRGNTRRPQPRDDDDDDDGAPVTSLADDDTGGFNYSEIRNSIDEIYRGFANGDATNVSGFWTNVRNIVASSPESNDYSVALSEIEDSLPQYTNVAPLYVDIINRLFGGFEN